MTMFVDNTLQESFDEKCKDPFTHQKEQICSLT